MTTTKERKPLVEKPLFWLSWLILLVFLQGVGYGWLAGGCFVLIPVLVSLIYVLNQELTTIEVEKKSFVVKNHYEEIKQRIFYVELLEVLWKGGTISEEDKKFELELKFKPEYGSPIQEDAREHFFLYCTSDQLQALFYTLQKRYPSVKITDRSKQPKPNLLKPKKRYWEDILDA